jgi:spermidine synthase
MRPERTALGSMNEQRGTGGRRVATLALVALALLAALGYGVFTARPQPVFDRVGDFGRVWVTERGDGLRSLYIGDGRTRQSAGYPDRPEHLEFLYTRVGMIGPALAPADGRILFVGLGGGSMPRYTRHVMPAARIEAVELDPLVVEVATRFFGVAADSLFHLHTGDGRAFIEATPAGRYDVIVLDAFSDDEIPFALSTVEFLRAVQRALAPDGVVISNLWSANPLYRSMVATYADVFDQVHLVGVGRLRQRILVAGPAGRPLHRDALVAAARDLAARAPLGFDLAAMVAEGYAGAATVAAPVLRDGER